MCSNVCAVSSKVCGVMLAQHISNPIETERAHPPVIVKLSLVCCRGSVHKKVIPDCNNEYTRFDSDLLCCCAKTKTETLHVRDNWNMPRVEV